MNFWQKMSQLCVIALIVIAAIVAVMLMCGVPAWLVIILYWVVLTGKNACDYLALKRK